MGTKDKILKNTAFLDSCFGCAVCCSVCPTDVLGMRRDADGFFRPIEKNAEACVGCSLCLKVCPAYNIVDSNKTPLRAYSTWHSDENQRISSTSGGFATALTTALANKGYSFFGVAYNYDTSECEYIMAEDAESIERLRGSKYIPVNTEGLIEKLNAAEKPAVIGTPCLIAGLKNAVIRGRLKNDVLFIDFFCHGVPSLNMWEKYIALRAEGEAVRKIIWRTTGDDWSKSCAVTVATDKKESVSSLFDKKGDLFFRSFLRDRCLAPQCYDDCRFKHGSSEADLRIGDLWGKKFAGNKRGVTGVVAFTERGVTMMNEMTGSGTVVINDEDVDTLFQGQMKTNASRPLSYGFFNVALKSKMALGMIVRIADIIDFPYYVRYVIKRIPAKLSELARK